MEITLLIGLVWINIQVLLINPHDNKQLKIPALFVDATVLIIIFAICIEKLYA